MRGETVAVVSHTYSRWRNKTKMRPWSYRESLHLSILALRLCTCSLSLQSLSSSCPPQRRSGSGSAHWAAGVRKSGRHAPGEKPPRQVVQRRSRRRSGAQSDALTAGAQQQSTGRISEPQHGRGREAQPTWKRCNPADIRGGGGGNPSSVLDQSCSQVYSGARFGVLLSEIQQTQYFFFFFLCQPPLGDFKGWIRAHSSSSSSSSHSCPKAQRVLRRTSPKCTTRSCWSGAKTSWCGGCGGQRRRRGASSWSTAT